MDAGKVSKIELTGDFSDFEFLDLMDILMEFNPGHSGSDSGSYPDSGYYPESSGIEETNYTPPDDGETITDTDVGHDDGPNDYQITNAKIYNQGDDSTVVASSSIDANNKMTFMFGDAANNYTVTAEITGTDFSPDGGAILQLAALELRLEHTVEDKLSRL